MEENLEPIKEVNNEISDIINKSNSEEVKDTKLEKKINLTANIDKSQNKLSGNDYFIIHPVLKHLAILKEEK